MKRPKLPLCADCRILAASPGSTLCPCCREARERPMGESEEAFLAQVWADFHQPRIEVMP